MITVSVKELKAALATLSPRRSSSLPITEYCLVETRAGGLCLTSNDLEMEIMARIPATCPVGVSFCVHVGQLKKLLSGSGEVTISQLTPTTVTVTCAGMSAILEVRPGTEFPRTALTGEKHCFTLNTAAFHTALCRVMHAMAKGDARYWLTAVYVDPAPEGVTLVASDGHRMAVHALPKTTVIPRGMIIPRDTVTCLAKLLKGQTDLMACVATLSHWHIVLPGVCITTRLHDAIYPDWRRIMAVHPHQAASVQRHELQRAGELADAQKVPTVVFDLHPGHAEIRVGTPDTPHTGRVPLRSIQGAVKARFGMDARYLLQLVKAVATDRLHIGVTADDKPFLFTTPVIPEFQALIAPIRL